MEYAQLLFWLLESLRENRGGSHANSISFIINGRQVGGIEAVYTHNRLSYPVPLPPCFNSKSIKTTKKAIGISFDNSLPLVSLSQATKAPRNTKKRKKKEKKKKEKNKKKKRRKKTRKTKEKKRRKKGTKDSTPTRLNIAKLPAQPKPWSFSYFVMPSTSFVSLWKRG